MRVLLIFAAIFMNFFLLLSVAAAADESSPSNKSSHKKSSAKSKTPAKKKVAEKTAAKKSAGVTKQHTTPTVATHHANDYQMITIYVYTDPGDVYQVSLPAVFLSEKFAAIRLDSSSTLEDLSVHSRIFVQTPHWVQMYPVDVEMESNWVLLKSDDRLPAPSPKFASAQTAAQMAKAFHYDSETQWLHDLTKIKTRTQEARSISSIASAGPGLLAAKVQSYGDHLTQVMQSAQKNLKMESYMLGPSLDGLPCSATSPVVNSDELQTSILGANAVACEAASPLQLAQNFNFTFRMQMGVLKMRAGENTADTSHLQLLQNIAARETENLRKMSSQIKYSTPLACESSHLSDKNVDIYYCTRGLRGFRNLSDSVVIVGRTSGLSYLYNMMRTAGFSPDSTQSIVQANINILEANP